MNRHQRRMANKQEKLQKRGDPSSVETLFDEAHRCQGRGALADAERLYRKILDVAPNHAAVHNNLGATLQRQGKITASIKSFEQACAMAPEHGDFHKNLGLAHLLTGNHSAAFDALRRAVRLEPHNELCWAHFATTLQNLNFESADDDLFDDMLQLLKQPIVRPSLISRPVLSALRCHPVFSFLLGKTQTPNGEQAVPFWEAAAQLSAIPLFLQLMHLGPIVDVEVERMLVSLRRDFLLSVTANKTVADTVASQGTPFVSALAVLCFFNEYVYAQTREETEAVERLQEWMVQALETGGPLPAVWVAALGSFRPLHALTFADRLQARQWPAEIQTVIDRQIAEPKDELRLRATVPCLTTIDDAISRAVRDQYEQNPYPQWIRTIVMARPAPIKSVLKTLFPYANLDDYQEPLNPEVLIAGCGTGQQVVSCHHRIENARILAIDLSLSSLAYAARKIREQGCGNIELAQADILQLGVLDRRFDVIECSGVLHHLQDPLAGWRVLVGLLKSGGVMKICLYSALARQSIVAARALIAEKGFAATVEGIRQCRQEVMSPSAVSGIAAILRFSDFFSLSECRDLLFHVQEHHFSLLQIEAALRDLGLEFIGFEMSDAGVLGRFRQTYPNPKDGMSLRHWHEFEQNNPSEFAGMYQFWCRKRA